MGRPPDPCGIPALMYRAQLSLSSTTSPQPRPLCALTRTRGRWPDSVAPSREVSPMPMAMRPLACGSNLRPAAAPSQHGMRNGVCAPTKRRRSITSDHKRRRSTATTTDSALRTSDRTACQRNLGSHRVSAQSDKFFNVRNVRAPDRPTSGGRSWTENP